MNDSLSLRAYNPVEQSHSHHFYQVVVPVHGQINIRIDDFDGLVSSGHCVVIKPGVRHAFSANENARFLVADLHDLPNLPNNRLKSFTTVSKAFRSFCLFAEIQLNSRSDPELELSMTTVFKHLLTVQKFLPNIDRRISKALAYIEQDISGDHQLENLASIASLSVSQFKLLFSQHTGMTAAEYVLTLRMERARALIVNTDTPLSIIAELCGYTDQSAFSRRFGKFFNIAPHQYRRLSACQQAIQHNKKAK